MWSQLELSATSYAFCPLAFLSVTLALQLKAADTKRSCEIIGWEGQRHGATVRCQRYLSRTRALGRPSEPRAAASCRAEFFILRRRSSPSSVFFTSSNQTLIKKLRHLHCPLVAGCSIPHKPLPRCVSGCTKFKKLKRMFPRTVHVISADSHHVNNERGGVSCLTAGVDV